MGVWGGDMILLIVLDGMIRFIFFFRVEDSEGRFGGGWGEKRGDHH